MKHTDILNALDDAMLLLCAVLEDADRADRDRLIAQALTRVVDVSEALAPVTQIMGPVAEA